MIQQDQILVSSLKLSQIFFQSFQIKILHALSFLKRVLIESGCKPFLYVNHEGLDLTLFIFNCNFLFSHLKFHVVLKVFVSNKILKYKSFVNFQN